MASAINRGSGKTSLIAFAFLALFVLSSSGCRCVSLSFYTRLNNADHVLKVDVLFGFSTTYDRYYIVRVSQIYKTNFVLNCNQIIVLRTSASSAACGVSLSVGSTYLITGYGNYSIAGVPLTYINLCGVNDLFTDVMMDCRKRRVLSSMFTPRCHPLCTKIYAPVCATADGVTFVTVDNACMARVRGLTPMYSGPCQRCHAMCASSAKICLSGEATCCMDGTLECPRVLPFIARDARRPLIVGPTCRPCGSSSPRLPLSDSLGLLKTEAEQIRSLERQITEIDMKLSTDRERSVLHSYSVIIPDYFYKPVDEFTGIISEPVCTDKSTSCPSAPVASIAVGEPAPGSGVDGTVSVSLRRELSGGSGSSDSVSATVAPTATISTSTAAPVPSSAPVEAPLPPVFAPVLDDFLCDFGFPFPTGVPIPVDPVPIETVAAVAPAPIKPITLDAVASPSVHA
eukprot:GILI01018487.1.p1 GENE.GILI01018487.1~~GILI01018487.1.p1  ORF type:complete len:456 (+),score=94.48 GILI01018487.1:1697-3064(+)